MREEYAAVMEKLHSSTVPKHEHIKRSWGLRSECPAPTLFFVNREAHQWHRSAIQRPSVMDYLIGSSQFLGLFSSNPLYLRLIASSSNLIIGRGRIHSLRLYIAFKINKTWRKLRTWEPWWKKPWREILGNYCPDVMKVFTGAKKLALAIYNWESTSELLYLDPEDVKDSPSMATLADLDLQSYRYELRGDQ